MDIEYEATFVDIDKDEIRARLKKIGAKLVRLEFLQKRVVFNLPKGHEIKGGWLRVRDEGDKITMSLKVVDGERIENQKEICLQVDSFEQAETLLVMVGCERKAFQESKRELWKLDGVEITIDEWPFLEPFVEIEGSNEEAVKKISKQLGFDYAKAFFGSVDTLYSKKYGLPEEVINNHTPKIVFEDDNPFKRKIIKHVSAGCLIVREMKNQQEILLLNCRWDDGTSGWVPPKGHVENGESLETAAKREVAEETGYVDVEIVRFLKQVDIVFETLDNQLNSKEIHWFLARLKSNRQKEVQHTDEECRNILDMKWVVLDKAIDLIPFEEEKMLVKSLMNE